MRDSVYSMANMGVIVILVAVLFSGVVHAQEPSGLAVGYGSVCEEVVDHEASASSTSFPASIGKIYCLTKIIGAKEQTWVTHVWYYGDTERARVKLAVKSTNWRTYSSKRIQTHETGPWHVDVVDKDGRVLQTYRFDIY